MILSRKWYSFLYKSNIKTYRVHSSLQKIMKLLPPFPLNNIVFIEEPEIAGPEANHIPEAKGSSEHLYLCPGFGTD